MRLFRVLGASAPRMMEKKKVTRILAPRKRRVLGTIIDRRGGADGH